MTSTGVGMTRVQAALWLWQGSNELEIVSRLSDMYCNLYSIHRKIG